MLRCRGLDGWLGSFVLRLQQRLTQIQQYRHTAGRSASYIQNELLDCSTEYASVFQKQAYNCC